MMTSTAISDLPESARAFALRLMEFFGQNGIDVSMDFNEIQIFIRSHGYPKKAAAVILTLRYRDGNPPIWKLDSCNFALPLTAVIREHFPDFPYPNQ